jgi:hypothetical protein
MKTVDYEALATASPVNRDAALARDGKGEKVPELTYTITCAHWDAPPKSKPIPKGQEDRRGQKVGRMTVVGYYDSHPKKGSRWIVRCSCGDYETRLSKAIKNQSNTRDRCSKCRRLETVKKMEYFYRTGRNYDRENF